MTPPIRMVSVPVEDLERIEKKLRHGGWPSDAKMVRAMLTAAPVREEGGVVWPEVTDAWADTYCALTGRDPDGQQVTFVDGGVATTFRNVAKREIEAMLCAAPKSAVASLATREEAPAEAGENWPTLADLHTIKGWLYGLSTAPDLTDVVADGGVSVGDCYQQEAREFAGRIERIIAALRAQPPARSGEGQ